MVESVAYKGADTGELFPLFLSTVSLNRPTIPEVSAVTPTRQFVLIGFGILLNCSPVSEFQTVSESFCELGEAF